MITALKIINISVTSDDYEFHQFFSFCPCPRDLLTARARSSLTGDEIP